MSVNPTCLVVIILLFISIILAFKVSALLCIRSTSDHGWNVPCWEVWVTTPPAAYTKQGYRHHEKKCEKSHRQTQEHIGHNGEVWCL